MLRGNCVRGWASPHCMPFKWMSPQMQKIRRFDLSACDTCIKMTSRRYYSLLHCFLLKQHGRKYARPLMNAVDVQSTELVDARGCVEFGWNSGFIAQVWNGEPTRCVWRDVGEQDRLCIMWCPVDHRSNVCGWDTTLRKCRVGNQVAPSGHGLWLYIFSVHL